jgi:hypothetical protein|eukprot:COSAG01_NODE_1386_length_10508_cov_2.215850_5_plen_49_part_00
MAEFADTVPDDGAEDAGAFGLRCVRAPGGGRPAVALRVAVAKRAAAVR